MSGGVDSSVAAAMLVRAGYDAVGCFMRLGSPGETIEGVVVDTGGASGAGAGGPACKPTKIGHQGCCSINDAADARMVAAELGIPFYVLNFKRDFGRIIDYFVEEYAAGRTPNPCVRCNDWLKFGKLHRYAQQIGAEFVASGHYARLGDHEGKPALLRGVDHSKDQSYVLFGVPPDRLGHMLLPIGAMEKPAVRDLAQRWGLPVFDKPDSQEICFVPDNDYASLVERRLGERAPRPGPIVDAGGETVGEHAGQHHFTIGQRRGLGVALGYPIFVIGKDPATNTITVGPREGLLVSRCEVGEANWLVDESGVGGGRAEWFACLAKYRYNTPAVAARARRGDDANGPTHSGRTGTFEVEFAEPQEAVAPGQALVLYSAGDPDLVLGGGWVTGTETPGRSNQ
ncbi:MAG: tRNA 2-thiouridine(34) synthase MnmA [Phycisphaerales bacterium]|nr:tRNA 2-thiouridine(34) synthase MnmA [Phycisphaerales bacterium]